MKPRHPPHPGAAPGRPSAPPGRGVEPTVLVVDDQAIYREAVTLALRAGGFNAISAANGKEALSAIDASMPDLLLLDVMMPELDAWGVLESLRPRPSGFGLRVMLLTSIADKDAVLRARGFGVRHYVLKKDFSLEELLGRVGACLGRAVPPAEERAANAGAGEGPGAEPIPPDAQYEAAVPRLLNRADVISRVVKVGEAKTLSGIVQNVIGLASSSRTSVDELAAVLKRDPVLSSRILQVANSPSYASRKGRVSNVDDAVRNLGLSTVGKIASAAGIFDAFGSDGPGRIDMLRCWQHSFAVADVMDRLLKTEDSGSAGLPHLVGLCHDLGEILLRQRFATEYATARDAAANLNRPVEEVESEVFGMSHRDLVRLLFSKVALPEAIANPIKELLSGDEADGAPARQMARALAMANAYAHGLQFAPSADALIEPIAASDFAACFAKGASPEIDADTLRGEVTLNTSLLARLSPADEAALAAPLLERVPARIWYSRPPALSPFDPVFAALRLWADAQLHPAPPAEWGQAAGFAAVVVATPRTAEHDEVVREAARLAAAAEGGPPVVYLSSCARTIDAARAVGARGLQYPFSLRAFHEALGSLAEVSQGGERNSAIGAAPRR